MGKAHSDDDYGKKEIEEYRTKLKQAEKLPASLNIKHEWQNGKWCIFYGRTLRAKRFFLWMIIGKFSEYREKTRTAFKAFSAFSIES